MATGRDHDYTSTPIYSPTPKRHSPERAEMLGRYMALHSQQTRLRQRLQESSPSPPLSPKSMATASPDMSSSEPSSASPSPTLEGQHHFSPISPPMFALPKPATAPKRTSSRSSPSTMAPIPEDDLLVEVSPSEEGKLYNVNLDIKSTLTHLLNCEAVRNDEKMRHYVQTRLMDAQMELKKQRRRRSSTPKTVAAEDGE